MKSFISLMLVVLFTSLIIGCDDTSSDPSQNSNNQVIDQPITIPDTPIIIPDEPIVIPVIPIVIPDNPITEPVVITDPIIPIEPPVIIDPPVVITDPIIPVEPPVVIVPIEPPVVVDPPIIVDPPVVIDPPIIVEPPVVVDPPVVVIPPVVVEPPVITDPIIPVITVTITRVITSIPIDVDFYYHVFSTNKIIYFKNQKFNDVICTYTDVTKTYLDGVLFSTSSTSPTTYYFTTFFSIGEASKVLYFTIEDKNYQQVNGIISEIVALPTRPIKQKVTYGIKNNASYITCVFINSTSSGIGRKLEGGGYSNSGQAQMIDGCKYTNIDFYSPDGVHITNQYGLIVNVANDGAGYITFPKKGLYIYLDQLHYRDPIFLQERGSMW